MSTDDATPAPEQSVFSTAGLGLVERLRQERKATRWNRGADTDYPTAWEPHPLCQEAAAEIERLRAAYENACAQRAAMNAAVAAERERWREIVRRVGNDGNRYGLEGCGATCEPSEMGDVITWTMGVRA